MRAQVGCADLALGRLTDKTLSVVSEGDHRWCGARTLSILNHTWLRSLHDSNTRVGGSKINADHVALDGVITTRTGSESSTPVKYCTARTKMALTTCNEDH